MSIMDMTLRDIIKMFDKNIDFSVDSETDSEDDFFNWDDDSENTDDLLEDLQSGEVTNYSLTNLDYD